MGCSTRPVLTTYIYAPTVLDEHLHPAATALLATNKQNNGVEWMEDWMEVVNWGSETCAMEWRPYNRKEPVSPRK